MALELEGVFEEKHYLAISGEMVTFPGGWDRLPAVAQLSQSAWIREVKGHTVMILHSPVKRLVSNAMMEILSQVWSGKVSLRRMGVSTEFPVSDRGRWVEGEGVFMSGSVGTTPMEDVARASRFELVWESSMLTESLVKFTEGLDGCLMEDPGPLDSPEFFDEFSVPVGNPALKRYSSEPIRTSPVSLSRSPKRTFSSVRTVVPRDGFPMSVEQFKSVSSSNGGKVVQAIKDCPHGYFRRGEMILVMASCTREWRGRLTSSENRFDFNPGLTRLLWSA